LVVSPFEVYIANLAAIEVPKKKRVLQENNERQT